MVKIDLNKVENKYDKTPQSEGVDWIKFREDIPEELVERFDDSSPLINKENYQLLNLL
jgi:hypothetical protein